ncbi:MAG: hypothetical protein AAFU51_10350 [Bacteroidota bacterium]
MKPRPPKVPAAKDTPNRSVFDGGLFAGIARAPGGSPYADAIERTRDEREDLRARIDRAGLRPSRAALALQLGGAAVGLIGGLSGNVGVGNLGVGVARGAQAFEGQRMSMAEAEMEAMREQLSGSFEHERQLLLKHYGLQGDQLLIEQRAQADEDLLTLREDLYGKRPDVQARVRKTDADTGLVEARTVLTSEQAETERTLRPLEARTERRQGDAAGALATQRSRVKDPEAVLDFASQRLADGRFTEEQARQYVENAGLSPDLLPLSAADPSPAAEPPPVPEPPIGSTNGGFVRPGGTSVPITLDLRERLVKMQQGLIDGTTTEEQVERVLRALGLDPDALE